MMHPCTLGHTLSNPGGPIGMSRRCLNCGRVFDVTPADKPSGWHVVNMTDRPITITLPPAEPSSVTFKFVVTKEVETDRGRQTIASISDDNARRLIHAAGLDVEVLRLKDHCERMLAIAAGRALGVLDQSHESAAVLSECQTMGVDTNGATATESLRRQGAGRGPTDVPLDRLWAYMNDPIVHGMTTAGSSADQIIDALAREKQRLGEHVVKLMQILPAGRGRPW